MTRLAAYVPHYALGCPAFLACSYAIDARCRTLAHTIHGQHSFLMTWRAA